MTFRNSGGFSGADDADRSVPKPVAPRFSVGGGDLTRQYFEDLFFFTHHSTAVFNKF